MKWSWCYVLRTKKCNWHLLLRKGMFLWADRVGYIILILDLFYKEVDYIMWLITKLSGCTRASISTTKFHKCLIILVISDLCCELRIYYLLSCRVKATIHWPFLQFRRSKGRRQRGRKDPIFTERGPPLQDRIMRCLFQKTPGTRREGATSRWVFFYSHARFHGGVLMSGKI